jgi:lysophospholipase L1-like esterase
MKSVARAGVIIALSTLLLATLLEGGTRLYLRLRDGQWPRSWATVVEAGRDNSSRIFRPRAFLFTGPREGTATVASGRHMSFNRAGYRSPERDRAKPAGTYRIVTAGGSTTFDIRVPSDEQSWPWQLEKRLHERGVPVEVWNAAFPGWTSVENVIALSIRDVDLHPDLVILFQGINDLQPAAHTPFDPQYEMPHAILQLAATGLSQAPMGWRDHSVFLARALPLARRWAGISEPQPFAAPWAAAPPRVDALPDEAVATFDRNVRSFVAVALAHGARVLLVTQSLRLRADHAEQDTADLQQWIPGMLAGTAVRELERFNDVLRGIAASGDAGLADAAREVPWSDGDFTDPMHFTAAGSRKLAAYLAGKVADLRAVPVDSPPVQ